MNENLPKDFVGRMVYSEEYGMGMIVIDEGEENGPCRILGLFEKPTGYTMNINIGCRILEANTFWFGPKDVAFTILPRIGEKILVWDYDRENKKERTFSGYVTSNPSPVRAEGSVSKHFEFITKADEEITLTITCKMSELSEETIRNLRKKGL